MKKKCLFFIRVVVHHAEKQVVFGIHSQQHDALAMQQKMACCRCEVVVEKKNRWQMKMCLPSSA